MSRKFTLRRAEFADVPELHQLIAASVRGLMQGDYTEAQLEAALGSAFGVDSELVRDGTYIVAVGENGELAGAGGWSKRATMFGGDGQANRESRLLDPAHEAARIRAFFVHPDWARQGIGRALLERCEEEARAAGFQTAELMSTLPGVRLYRDCGYEGELRTTHDLPGGLTIDFVPMRKRLTDRSVP